MPRQARKLTDAGKLAAFSVDCPHCGAKACEWCRYMPSGTTRPGGLSGMHNARYDAGQVYLDAQR